MEKDTRELWYDPRLKVSVTVADATSAARALARGHLAGPASSYFLAKALAAVSLLAAETEEPDETVSIQMKCDGPLGGFNVECSHDGALRGYTERKTLDDFDCRGKAPDETAAVGQRRLQVTRSVPGRIISQGISNSLDGYIAGSLQRKARIFLEAATGEDGEVLEARGLLVEAMPDSAWAISNAEAATVGKNGKKLSLAVSARTLLKRLGLASAEKKSSSPLFFKCRCSRERIEAILAALPRSERDSLPPDAAITCHMCGRTWTLGG